MKYHQNAKNPNKIFTFFFQEKLEIFSRLRAIKCTDWARIGTIRLEHLEEQGLS